MVDGKTKKTSVVKPVLVGNNGTCRLNGEGEDVSDKTIQKRPETFFIGQEKSTYAWGPSRKRGKTC
jgi:hypothetical protein